MLAARVLGRARVAGAVASSGRSFWSVNPPVASGVGGVHVTKYRIVKPERDGTLWDDFLLQLPDKDHLAKTTKEVPLFLRYLRVVAHHEKRPADLKQFLERCKAGLVVESDAYITMDELLATMWKNGYSDSERNAVQFTFPSDYKFHYPELAVAFTVEEEDAYKFCMRKRIEASHIGELEVEKVKRRGFIRDHWLIFGSTLFLLKSFPFYNYYFGVKIFGTAMWGWTNWMLFNRWISSVTRRNEYMASQKTAQDVMDGEEKLVDAMSRFAGDTGCIKSLQGFRADVQTKTAAYKQALLEIQQDKVTESAAKQVQLIQQAEAANAGQLQSVLVSEVVSAFRREFLGSPDMQSRQLAQAISALQGNEAADPTKEWLASAVSRLGKVDFAKTKGNTAGSIEERVAAVQQAREADFVGSFYVSTGEVSKVKELAKAAGGAAAFDVAKLSEQQLNELEALYRSVNSKVGFAATSEAELVWTPIGSGRAASYASAVAAEVDASKAALRNARLGAFVGSFV